jgi:outer membrane receptor for ferrienterochelin and colicins
MAGKYNINSQIALRANYTYIDSEQKNGQQEGLPLSGSAKHMYNVAIDYKPTPKIKTYLILTGEQKRYGGIPKGGNASNAFWYKDYSVLNAGASYKANKNVTITARINNLLDKDFTSYTTQFIDNGGSWEPSYQEDYNTKAKAREFWLSINVRI